MKTTYYPDTDTVQIDIRPAMGQVSGMYHDNDDIVFYVDEAGRLTEIFFDLASTYMDKPETCTYSRAIRTGLSLSQQQFADMLDIGVKRIHSWDQGLEEPDRTALRLMEIAALHPDMFGVQLAA